MEWINKNYKGETIQVLLIGTTEQFDSFQKFIHHNMSNSSSDKNVLKGHLTLGCNTYDVQFEIVSWEDFQKNIEAEDPKEDGLIFYEIDISPSWLMLQPNVKCINIYDPEDTSPDFGYFYSHLGEEDLSMRLEKFLKKASLPKEVRPSHPADFGDGMPEIILKSMQKSMELKSDLQITEEKQPHKETIMTELTNFLSLKYTYKGAALYDEVEKVEWKQKLKDWPQIRSCLTEVDLPEPRDIITETVMRPIRVILPPDDNNEDRNFRLLKAAAYYPFQYDPWPRRWANYEDIDLMYQLALSCHYGRWDARDCLYESTISAYGCLPENHPFSTPPATGLNLEDTYYNFAYPLNDDGAAEENYVRNDVDFDIDDDKEATIAFFERLLDIAKFGTKPSFKRRK